MNTYERIAQLIYESLSVNEGFEQYFRVRNKSKKNPKDKRLADIKHKLGHKWAHTHLRRLQASGLSPEEYSASARAKEEAGREASRRRKQQKEKEQNESFSIDEGKVKAANKAAKREFHAKRGFALSPTKPDPNNPKDIAVATKAARHGRGGTAAERTGEGWTAMNVRASRRRS